MSGLALAALALPDAARAADLEVGPDRAFGDVQAAVDAAASGDRITVFPGLYGPVTVPQDLDVTIAGATLHTATIEPGSGDTALTVRGTLTLRGLVVDGMGGARPVRVVGALVVEDGVIRAGRSSEGGGCVLADDGDLTLRRTEVSDCQAPYAGAISSRQTVVVEGGTVRDAAATDGFGGGIHVEGGELSVRGTTFERDTAFDARGYVYGAGYGGAIDGSGAVVEVHGCKFVDDGASSVDGEGGFGGAIHVWDSALTVTGSSFDANDAGSLGSAISAWQSTLDLDSSRFRTNLIDRPYEDTPYGGTVYCDNYAGCTIDRSWFDGNTAGDGGAVCAVGDLTLTTSMFCGNRATSDGGAVDVGNGWASVRIDGNVFVANVADGDGGGIVLGARSDVFNNHFVSNESIGGAGAVDSLELGGEATATFDSNLVAYNQGYSPALSLPYLAFEAFDLWGENAPYTSDLPPGEGTLEQEPGLLGMVGCDAGVLALAPDSPAVDAGDPSRHDADGSRADIGAFGGPFGDHAAFVDGDGDGWAEMVDCDDGDGARNPDAPEVCDGVDNDCDGLVDAADDAIDAGWLHPDPDGDGFGAAAGSQWACPGDGWASALEEPLPTTTAPPTRPTTGPVGGGGDGDGDGDGVVDLADGAPDDPGGASASAPAPPYGCGCAAAPGLGRVSGLGVVVIGLATARARRGPRVARGAPAR